MAEMPKPIVEWSKWLPPGEQVHVSQAMSKRSHTDDGHRSALSSFVPARKRRVSFIHLSSVLVPAESCNFWLCNTNVRLTQSVVKKLEAVAGVERLYFLSRYRFRMLVGTLFPEEGVKQEVEKVLLNHV